MIKNTDKTTDDDNVRKYEESGKFTPHILDKLLLLNKQSSSSILL